MWEVSFFILCSQLTCGCRRKLRRITCTERTEVFNFLFIDQHVIFLNTQNEIKTPLCNFHAVAVPLGETLLLL
jgi:hypothetical protein